LGGGVDFYGNCEVFSPEAAKKAGNAGKYYGKSYFV
jgi:hypothetical protein